MKLTMLMVDRNKRTVSGPTWNCGMTAVGGERLAGRCLAAKSSRICRASSAMPASRHPAQRGPPRRLRSEPPLPRRRDAARYTLTLAVAFCAIPRSGLLQLFPSRIGAAGATAAQPTAAQLFEFAKKDSRLQVQRRLPGFDEAAPTSGDSDAAPSAPRRKLWVAEIAAASLGCTRRTCLLAPPARGGRFPWSKDTDVFVLAGLHALACATFHYDVAAHLPPLCAALEPAAEPVLGIRRAVTVGAAVAHHVAQLRARAAARSAAWDSSTSTSPPGSRAPSPG